MFFNIQEKYHKDEYEKFLKMVGSLSNLFSESSVPYLYYRVAEKIFCKAFGADDLSRSDVSIDAKKLNVGIGLKTFLADNNRTLQKVAEIGGSKNLYENLDLEEKVLKIAEIRNSRIEFTHRLFEIDSSIYHCVVREQNMFKIFEEPMNLIDINNIRNIKENKGSISFEDGKEEYSFLLSKNTLTKRFITKKSAYEFEVDILANPLDLLTSCLKDDVSIQDKTQAKEQSIFLPLYGKNHIVYEKSGLNQWNAKGRVRDINEVYIPVPIKIHKEYPDFFPSREHAFNLRLPNGKIMKSKICQDGGKALMSYSNKELGEWILRDVLKLKEGELLTYEKLQSLGIDSVRIDKIDDMNFDINFANRLSYDEFIDESHTNREQ